MEEWLAFTPNGILLFSLGSTEDPSPYRPLFFQQYRSEWLLLVDQNALEAMEAAQRR
jgi:hypothetical protein